MPSVKERELSWFTPLPPARNGIADYAHTLLSELQNIRRCVVYCDDVLATAPEAVEIRDQAQAFRYLKNGDPILHQIGNNGGHIFVLEALRRYSGVVALHDLSLLYLYELATPRLESIMAGMQSQNRALGALYGKQWKENRLKTEANYVLFDMVGEILSKADGLVVHSQYALNKLRSTYGPDAASRIAVIPHFAPTLKIASSEEARAKLSIPANETIVLTSGFATKAKRFDWLIEALDALLQRGSKFRWIHAGEERSTEFPLRQAVEKHPYLREAFTITGYVAEDDLDAYIAAADVVVNLRFPSVGESSGTLARAFSARRCCIVNDTAAYSEIPREAAVHVPTFDTVAALTRALEALLGDAELRTMFGERAQRFARSALALNVVAKQYSDFIETIRSPVRRKASTGRGQSDVEPVLTRFEIDDVNEMDAGDLRRRVSDIEGQFEAIFWFDSAEQAARYSLDAPGLLQGAFGPHVKIETLRFSPRPPGRRPDSATPAGNSGVGLSIIGRAYGW